MKTFAPLFPLYCDCQDLSIKHVTPNRLSVSYTHEPGHENNSRPLPVPFKLKKLNFLRNKLELCVQFDQFGCIFAIYSKFTSNFIAMA